jgi:predicted SprT family Zn-dependent metalloprotease
MVYSPRISDTDAESIFSIISNLRVFFEFTSEIEFSWFPRGTLAGYAEVDYSPVECSKTPELCYDIKYYLKLNHGLYRRHKRYIEEIILPHEFCHLVCASRYGESVKPHGPEWQALMLQLRLDPDPYHDLDVQDMEYWKFRNVFRCSICKQHTELTRYMSRQPLRYCEYCDSVLFGRPVAQLYVK